MMFVFDKPRLAADLVAVIVGIGIGTSIGHTSGSAWVGIITGGFLIAMAILLIGESDLGVIETKTEDADELYKKRTAAWDPSNIMDDDPEKQRPLISAFHTGTEDQNSWPRKS